MSWNPYDWSITCDHCGDMVSGTCVNCPHCGENIWSQRMPDLLDKDTPCHHGKPKTISVKWGD